MVGLSLLHGIRMFLKKHCTKSEGLHMRFCKDECRKFKPISIIIGEKIYKGNVKFCKVCDIRLELVGFRCPCCKSNVRCKSHCMKWKNKTRRMLLN